MDLALLLAGAAVSVLVQVIKKYFGTDTVGTLAAVVVISVVGGLGFWYLQQVGYWEAFLQIVVSAGAVYGFIIKNVEDSRA